ncbi:unnamed protein product [Ambrosiozyma monospora]|uniref:Unnamed protein product n=1 Tax=Ambrosiozyma monospora TaxID=43982 RepID=A0A9W6TB19_AMBMO|nr:unnamed protein product [Ambrosiozyma monospora]
MVESAMEPNTTVVAVSSKLSSSSGEVIFEPVFVLVLAALVLALILDFSAPKATVPTISLELDFNGFFKTVTSTSPALPVSQPTLTLQTSA